LSNLSKNTIDTLGPILTRRSDKKYILDLTTIPILSRKYVKMTSGTTLASEIWREKLLVDQISLYNYYKKKTEESLGKKSLKKSDLSEESAQFLAQHCYIKNGSYNPPVKTVAEDDEYNAYKFSINIQGFSKVSASPIVKKLDEQKNTTQREVIIKEAYKKYHNTDKFKIKGEPLLKNLEEKISELNKELKDVRNFIQLSKFAIILGNKCKMDEFESRDDMSLTLDLYTLNKEEVTTTFDFKIEKTTIQI